MKKPFLRPKRGLLSILVLNSYEHHLYDDGRPRSESCQHQHDDQNQSKPAWITRIRIQVQIWLAVLPKGGIAEAQTWVVARPAKHHPHCLCVRCVPLLLDNIKLLIDLGELGLYLLLDVSQGVWRGLEYESLYNTRGHQRVTDSYRPAALGRCHLLHLRSFDKIRQYR